MAQQGKTADEIVSYIEQIKPKVRASFVVDTLVYLYRGGRCSGLAAMAGSMLKLHPRIGVADGKMSPGKKYRGKIGKVVMDYVKDMEADLVTAKKDRVFMWEKHLYLLGVQKKEVISMYFCIQLAVDK